MTDEFKQLMAEIDQQLKELQDAVIKMQIDLHAYRLEREIAKAGDWHVPQK